MVRISYTKHITFEQFKEQFESEFHISNVELRETQMRKMYDKVNPPESVTPIAIESVAPEPVIEEEKPKRTKREY